MRLIDRLFARRQPDSAAAMLYPAVVARARAPHWFVEGAVADTLDGRFDTIAALLAFTMLRLEAEPGMEAAQVSLSEAFVDDMDPQLRQIGFGDMVVGKHVGRMMGMLAGRLGAYREGLAEGTLDAALVRNLYRGEAPDPAALAHVRQALLAYAASLAATDGGAIAAGRLP